MQVNGDVWILSQVLHDWPDAECRTILVRCRERTRSGDRLLVVEMVPVPGQPDVGIALLDSESAPLQSAAHQPLCVLEVMLASSRSTVEKYLRQVQAHMRLQLQPH